MRVLSALFTERQWREGEVLSYVLIVAAGVVALAVYLSGRRS